MSMPLFSRTLDQVTFQLAADHPFEWLTEMGVVFAVFDQQDSGNISFGIEKDGLKKFVKYAGAPTRNYKGKPEEAVQCLIRAIPLYEHLQHDHLIRLHDHFEVGGGYAAVFEWFEGETLHAHWSFPPPSKYTDSGSPYFRFKQLPLERKLASLDSIFSFHKAVEERQYVAVDFYDGSILYDFEQHVTRICDIDLYQRIPFVNKMGRLWGSSRFMSPEEFELGALIDKRTNVFNMGAVAFSLIGGERDRSCAKWEASDALYQVAAKAVSLERDERFASVAAFYDAWNEALS
ncbi:serine/threonine protein kinase [Paenibacillus taiwanensis]|uniref:serine/threonine protein kinase n=1 Tax=Paenibacillus taiwanensis TaxID=401638 RepID=UPI0004276779|nr:serine/threonine protein kinase [Paenibacillus taiwanensis]